MSKVSAETSLALFDRMQGRGDVLSIHVEDGAGLAALDAQTFASIVHPLFKWWATGVEDVPSGPLARMMYERLKTHQLENAVRRGINLKNWADNAAKGGRPKGSKKPSGNQAETKRVQLEVSSIKTEDASSKSSVLDTSEDSADGAGRGGLTPPARPSLSAEEARQVLAMDAPPITSHTHSKLKTEAGHRTQWCWRYLNAYADTAALMVALEWLYPDALNEVSRHDAETLQEVLNDNDTDCLEDWDLSESFKKTPLGAFLNSSVQIYTDATDVLEEKCGWETLGAIDTPFSCALLAAAIASENPEVKNPAGFILARLRRVSDAVVALECAKVKKPSDAPLSELEP